MRRHYNDTLCAHYGTRRLLASRPFWIQSLQRCGPTRIGGLATRKWCEPGWSLLAVRHTVKCHESAHRYKVMLNDRCLCGQTHTVDQCCSRFSVGAVK